MSLEKEPSRSGEFCSPTVLQYFNDFLLRPAMQRLQIQEPDDAGLSLGRGGAIWPYAGEAAHIELTYFPEEFGAAHCFITVIEDYDPRPIAEYDVRTCREACGKLKELQAGHERNDPLHAITRQSQMAGRFELALEFAEQDSNFSLMRRDLTAVFMAEPESAIEEDADIIGSVLVDMMTPRKGSQANELSPQLVLQQRSFQSLDLHQSELAAIARLLMGEELIDSTEFQHFLEACGTEFRL